MPDIRLTREIVQIVAAAQTAISASTPKSAENQQDRFTRKMAIAGVAVSILSVFVSISLVFIGHWLKGAYEVAELDTRSQLNTIQAAAAATRDKVTKLEEAKQEQALKFEYLKVESRFFIDLLEFASKIRPSMVISNAPIGISGDTFTFPFQLESKSASHIYVEMPTIEVTRGETEKLEHSIVVRPIEPGIIPPQTTLHNFFSIRIADHNATRATVTTKYAAYLDGSVVKALKDVLEKHPLGQQLNELAKSDYRMVFDFCRYDQKWQLCS